MKLKVVRTGSLGNCYVLENETEALLIECGVKMKDIKQALDFDFSKVKGCIVSHAHLDHSKSMNDLMKAGINVFASEATHESMGTTMHHRGCKLPPNQKLTLGGFQIKAFEVDHDGTPCYGFVIFHKECGKTIFITDAKYVPFTFKNLNNIIIEANYSKAIIDQKLLHIDNPKQFLRNRVFRSHMSLETCEQALRANDLSKVNNVLLIHLSDGNSHAVNFKKQIEAATGKNVTVAENGMQIEFNQTSF